MAASIIAAAHGTTINCKLSPSLRLHRHAFCRKQRNSPQSPQARITTKYKILTPESGNPRKRKAATDGDVPPSARDQAGPSQIPTAPRGTLVLKTYDPVSGVCLKYRTDKAAELNRLIASLGKLGRNMAALPEVEESTADTAMTDARLEEQPTGTSTPLPEAVEKGAETAPEMKAGQGGGGGKKRKKGKK